MKNAVVSSIHTHSNKIREADDEHPSISTSLSSKGRPKCIAKSALLRIRSFNVDVPLTSASTGSSINSIRLEADRVYTIGRGPSNPDCDFLFSNRNVSKQHCQILFDGNSRKIYIRDGVFLMSSCICNGFRRRLSCYDHLEGKEESTELSRVRFSLNGVFVNGVKVMRGMVRELCAGDEVLLGCGNEGTCNLGFRIGFSIVGVVIEEASGVQLERRMVSGKTTSIGHSQGSASSGKRNRRVFAVPADEIISHDYDLPRLKYRGTIGRAKLLLSRCREILNSDDPVSYIQQRSWSDSRMVISDNCPGKYKNVGRQTFDTTNIPLERQEGVNGTAFVSGEEAQPCDNSHILQDMESNEEEREMECVSHRGDFSHQKDNSGVQTNHMVEETAPLGDVQTKPLGTPCQPPGKKFYLNRLQFMDHNSTCDQNVISLPELLHPIDNLVRIFIATFTSDVPWFLSYCGIPSNLPVTIACHNSERCWSSSPDERISMPCPDFPNLVLISPPFPDAIAFGHDRRRQGIACHHPKLFVLQREDSMRVIITSANLVSYQWNNVTNTIWWQDFPLRKSPDISSLFIRVSVREGNRYLKSDFAAQLAGFMASLLIDVPNQAYWITEIAKYNFEGATGYLVASVPGIHSSTIPYADKCGSDSGSTKFLGWVETSAVGLSYLFRKSADRNGVQLKRLASFLGRSCENTCGMSEIVLRRNTNVSADVNAVSIFVPNPDQLSEGDYVQLGFLPRNVAKWVSPLWDSGYFMFSGYVHPKEALAAALGETNMTVQLILYVSQGPHFPDILNTMLPEHVIAVSTLIASIQRCTGLSRLQEVLDQYKWPELDQSDFVYGASSIGSVNAQFLAAFSAATGKRSLQLFDSEESDPEWGCWTASQELRNPSVRIVFPTIERVKTACNGVLSSRRILCFAEKSWQRLRSADIVHDAVPHPSDRVGHPMHIKVARRRFWSKSDGSSGWVYCGSHNFSAAAWGRSISTNRTGAKSNEPGKPSSSSVLKLHVSNYELGIIFIFPPSASSEDVSNKDVAKLDDITMPYVMPPPKYGPRDRPATKLAMREASIELTMEQERGKSVELEDITEDIPDEEEIVETNYNVAEKEEDKAYAEMLWTLADSSKSS
ncbi:forkhead-associated domain-containing protein / FHA domain-containing protein [Euphorbia peplus]|nr:forkhead-associated domain-containing protein / FHA domain-containing protein [Euphorbia peplus]